jgi:hypothetical protein
MKNSFIIVSQSYKDCNNDNHSHQLSLPLQVGKAQKQPTQDYPLTIDLLPDTLQWWSEPRYWLIHKDSGLRVPGSFSEKEALHIREVTKHWDWSVDSRDRKVACGLNLLALAEIVCSRSSQQGGEV